MLRYMWPDDNPKLKLYLLGSVLSLLIGKWITLQIPFAFQRCVDLLTTLQSAASQPGVSSQSTIRNILKQATIGIAYYGLSKTISSALAEIKAILFTNVSQYVCRKYAADIFQKLHSLSSEFHVSNPSGMISVSFVRAVRGFQCLLFEIVFSVAPMLIELGESSAVSCLVSFP